MDPFVTPADLEECRKKALCLIELLHNYRGANKGSSRNVREYLSKLAEEGLVAPLKVGERYVVRFKSHGGPVFLDPDCKEIVFTCLRLACDVRNQYAQFYPLSSGDMGLDIFEKVG